MALCTPPYVGRFAPSPTGPLHFGSLVCALASYLEAKAHKGTWLVRIEDLDPPREKQGATESLLHSLQAHHLHWDGEVMYQAHRHHAYEHTLSALTQEGLLYPCACNRKRLQSLDREYDAHCLSHPPPEKADTALRINLKQALEKGYLKQRKPKVEDRLQNQYTEDLLDHGDFIVRRKDGLFAYQLAVVVDDIYQGITDVVRGNDLLDSSAKQSALFEILGRTAPTFAHHPVVVDKAGVKLSKQTGAKAINNDEAKLNLLNACKTLSIPIPKDLAQNSLSEILNWALEHWDIKRLAHIKTLPLL